MPKPQRIEIKPNERVFIAGKTGSGKTFLAKRILRSAVRLVVIDSKGTLNDWGLEEWNRDTQRRLDTGDEVRVRVALDVGQDSDRFWAQVLSQVYQAADVVLYIDEALQIVSGKQTKEMLTGIWTRGREFDISAIAASQRPKNIPLTLLSEGEHFFMFRLFLDDDVDRMSELMGPKVKENIPPADRHGFYYYNVNWNEAVYYQKLPARDPLEQGMEDVPAIELQEVEPA